MGSAPITPGQLQVSYSLNSGTPVTVTVQTTLQSLDTLTVTIGNVTIPTGPHTLCVYTTLAGDSNLFNNEKCKGVFGELYASLPYTDGFEGTSYWHATGPMGSWEHGIPAGTTINSAHGGTKVWLTRLSTIYENNGDEYLYSPRFNFSGVQPADTATLSFWHWMQSQANNDAGHIQYSINGGQSWVNLGFIGDPAATNWYNTNIGGTHCFSGTSAGWSNASFKLPPMTFNGQSLVQFRFHFFSNATTNNYDGWAIDDFKISLPVLANDVGVSVILQPNSGTVVNSQVNVQVRIKNYGSNVQTSIPVLYQVNNLTPVLQTWTGTLNYGDSADFTFSTAYSSPATNYQLCARTQLAGDGYPGNDQSCRNLQSLAAPWDAGVVEVIHPKDTVCRDMYPKPVIVKMTNWGTSVISTMPVQYQINSVTPVVETWTGTMNPGDTVTYQFNTLFTVPIGVFMVCAKTNLVSDANPANDKQCNTVASVSCNGIEDGTIDGFALGQNIPNPARDLTRISCDIPASGKILFSVTNLLGQEVHAETASRDAGHHVIDLDISGLPSGTYYYSVEYQGNRLSRKMVIVR
jgi:hypothetical protein